MEIKNKNMIKKYVKKPDVIEAIQYIGGNVIECTNFIGEDRCPSYDGQYLAIKTLEGTMRVNIGDYIIKGVRGEYYPCKEDIFIETYEEYVGN